MNHLNPRMAQALIQLLAAIDTDHPKDFMDVVCTARDALPTGTSEALADIAAQADTGSDVLLLPILHDDLDRACEALLRPTDDDADDTANAALADQLKSYL